MRGDDETEEPRRPSRSPPLRRAATLVVPVDEFAVTAQEEAIFAAARKHAEARKAEKKEWDEFARLTGECGLGAYKIMVVGYFRQFASYLASKQAAERAGAIDARAVELEEKRLMSDMQSALAAYFRVQYRERMDAGRLGAFCESGIVVLMLLHKYARSAEMTGCTTVGTIIDGTLGKTHPKIAGAIKDEFPEFYVGEA